MDKRTSGNHPLPLEWMFREDGSPPCADPEACSVCSLFVGPSPGETRQAWLARIGELYRAAPPIRRNQYRP